VVIISSLSVSGTSEVLVVDIGPTSTVVVGSSSVVVGVSVTVVGTPDVVDVPAVLSP